MYGIKFVGTRGNPEQYLTEQKQGHGIGDKEKAAKFEDNEKAIDAALGVTKQMAMFGLPTRSFQIVILK